MNKRKPGMCFNSSWYAGSRKALTCALLFWQSYWPFAASAFSFISKGLSSNRPCAGHYQASLLAPRTSGANLSVPTLSTCRGDLGHFPFQRELAATFLRNTQYTMSVSECRLVLFFVYLVRERSHELSNQRC